MTFIESRGRSVWCGLACGLALLASACSADPGAASDRPDGSVVHGRDASVDGSGGESDGTVTNVPDGATDSEGDAATDVPPDAGDAAPEAGPTDGAAGTSNDGGGPLDVQTAAGPVHGKVVEQGVRVFLGIPYAKPPTGALRFAAPIAATPWTATRDATAFGPSCVQPRDGIGGALDEDCLSLNVFAPSSPPPEGAPVMVFIHGGGFGSGGSSGFPAQWLVGPRGVVVVTINYRLGRLAFLTTPELDTALGGPSGNLGLKDQQLALRWVRDNARAFGGDPANVTVFGQSAGAISACYHLFMKGSETLLDRAILESGACLTGVFGPRPRADVVSASASLVNQLCPLASDPVACLRGLPASAFVPASVAAATTVLDATSSPYVDGDLIQGSLLDRLRAGTFHHVPILGGSNAREPAYYEMMGVPAATNRLGFTLTLATLAPDHWQALNDHFMPATDADANEALMRALTDDEFRCPMRVMARGISDHGMPAFLYSFEVPPSGHAQELEYVFGWPGAPLSVQYDGGAPVPQLPAVLDATQAYWTNFARASDPNDGVHVAWPAYTRAGDGHMTLGTSVVARSGLAKADCDWWDTQFAP